MQAQHILGPYRQADHIERAQMEQQMMYDEQIMQARYQSSGVNQPQGAFNPAMSGYPGAGYQGYPGYTGSQFGYPHMGNPHFGMSFGQRYSEGLKERAQSGVQEGEQTLRVRPVQWGETRPPANFMGSPAQMIAMSRGAPAMSRIEYEGEN